MKLKHHYHTVISTRAIIINVLDGFFYSFCMEKSTLIDCGIALGERVNNYASAHKFNIAACNHMLSFFHVYNEHGTPVRYGYPIYYSTDVPAPLKIQFIHQS